MRTVWELPPAEAEQAQVNLQWCVPCDSVACIHTAGLIEAIIDGSILCTGLIVAGSRALLNALVLYVEG